MDTKILNDDIRTDLQIGKLNMLSIMLDGCVAVCTVGPSVKVVRSKTIQIHKAKSMYSKNTNALLLEVVKLVCGFIILRSSF